ncbi:MAG: RdgB/HAM1 family non-canonical purine NTP pyrophosphatase [Bryobacteraceae bacterium]
MKIYCASTNADKLREFQLAATVAFEVEPLPGMRGLPRCPETGASFHENAVQKALHYGSHSKLDGEGYLLAEDSGLSVDGLNGEPGIYSARYAGKDATDAENNQLLLERLGQRRPRTARFVSVITLLRSGIVHATVEGSVEGEILFAPRGSHGFGYDPIFFYPPLQRSFGELTAEVKQSVSHRAQAMQHLSKLLANA